jgi:hypothetical protein
MLDDEIKLTQFFFFSVMTRKRNIGFGVTQLPVQWILGVEASLRGTAA